MRPPHRHHPARAIGLMLMALLLLPAPLAAQQYEVLPTHKVGAMVQNGDTLLVVRLRPIVVYPPMRFKSKKQEKFYWRNVRDVKKVLPFAKLAHATLIETYEFIMTLPEEDRADHLKRMEKELFEEYKPTLKRFTFRQGKLLIRLIDRECNQTSYNLVKAFLGSFRAGFWQTFGSLFGVSLRKEWDPEGKDAELERIVVLVEQGAL